MSERCLSLNYESLKNNRRLYYFFNHDESLLCWYYEKYRLNFNNFFLITIDHHIDWAENFEEERELLTEFFQNRDEQNNNNEELGRLSDPILQNVIKLREIIEKSFRGDNISFLIASLELGLINDVLIISPNDEDHGLPSTYKDTQGGTHRIYRIRYISGLLNPLGRGVLNDSFKLEYRKIQEKLKESPYIIDFDLDYFTYSQEDNDYVINEENFDFCLQSLKNSNLVSKAKVITIALEPGCCGGIQNSAQIFLKISKFIKDLKP